MAECPDDSIWPAVTSFEDGDNVDAETLNAPIRQLAARTEHLLRLLQQNDRTKVAVVDAQLSDPDNYGVPDVGSVVYRASDGTYAKAIGSAEENAWFYAAQKAMAVGVVGSKAPGASTGTVVLCGYVSFDDGIDASQVIADANPSSGRYYLSNTVEGKLTANPSGPIIYVCDCHVEGGKVTSMLVNPQYRDTGESHVHRSFVIDWKPMGGYDGEVNGTSYEAYGCFPNNTGPAADGSTNGLIWLQVAGAWDTDLSVTYEFTLERKSGSSGSTNWGDYQLRCTSSGDASAVSKVIPLAALAGDTLSEEAATAFAPVGSHQMQIRAVRPAGSISDYSPAAMVSAGRNVWTVSMPDDGRGWRNEDGGFVLDLGMYPAMARYVPLVPSNSGSLVVGGVELRGQVFGADKQWSVTQADSDGGPWLHWIGNSVVGDGSSPTTPWVHAGSGVQATGRPIVFHVGRMRVGPTGFVTSLQPAPGAPLKITSALTDEKAAYGALQIGLDVDFKTGGGDAEGFQVVKRIEGTTFMTGPVVERVVAGPGVAVNQEQGTVRLSVANAAYAGDFETIALKNAKQDLAAGVFPYTKLLGWGAGSNIASGFTAKFRVPDHIPYNADHGYWVVVSASVFGEESYDSDAVKTASFALVSYVLGDQACSADAGSAAFGGSIAAPVSGKANEKVGVQFAGPYTAFDPVLVHGFRNASNVAGPGTIVLPDTGSRRSEGALWLKQLDGTPVVVHPGYFVGLSIQRCASTGTAYTAPIGFMSLRWNLVEAT